MCVCVCVWGVCVIKPMVRSPAEAEKNFKYYTKPNFVGCCEMLLILITQGITRSSYAFLRVVVVREYAPFSYDTAIQTCDGRTRVRGQYCVEQNTHTHTHTS